MHIRDIILIKYVFSIYKSYNEAILLYESIYQIWSWSMTSQYKAISCWNFRVDSCSSFVSTLSHSPDRSDLRAPSKTPYFNINNVYCNTYDTCMYRTSPKLATGVAVSVGWSQARGSYPPSINAFFMHSMKRGIPLKVFKLSFLQL